MVDVGVEASVNAASTAIVTAINALPVGLYHSGIVDSIDTGNKFTVTALAGLGANRFKDTANPYQVFVAWDAGGLGAAPQGEIRGVTAYNTATGEFTTAAFSSAVGAGDIIVVMHPQLALGALVPTANATTNKTVAEVLGNKTDVANVTADEASLVGLTRYIIATPLVNIKTALMRQQQTDVTLSGDGNTAPVTDTAYDVLTTTVDAEIEGVELDITWGVTQPTNLRIIVTVDGKTITYTVASPVSTTKYYPTFDASLADAAQVLGTTWDVTAQQALKNMSGRSVKIQAAVTWDTTQPTPMNCRVKYSKL